MGERMSLRAYARHRGALGLPGGSLAGVQRALSTGRITVHNGKVDPVEADQQWAANTRRAATPEEVAAALAAMDSMIASGAIEAATDAVLAGLDAATDTLL